MSLCWARLPLSQGRVSGVGSGWRKPSNASNCGKDSQTLPYDSGMTVTAEFSVTSERSSAYHRNVGNSRKTVNFSLAG